MAFATAADVVTRFDDRVVRDLLSDTGEPATDIDTNPNLLAILNSASGHVLSAAISGNNYTEAEITALIAANGMGAAIVVDMVCQIAFCKMMRRRPGKFPPETIAGMEESVNEWLTQLRQGKRLLPIDNHVEASAVTIDGPTALDYQRLNLITSRTQNFYPSVSSRLPIGRG